MIDDWKIRRAEAERLHSKYAEIENAERAHRAEQEAKHVIAIGHMVNGVLETMTEVQALRVRQNIIIDTLAQDNLTEAQADALTTELAQIECLLDENLPY